MFKLRELPPLQQTILKKLIVLQRERPLPFDSYYLYKQFDYRRYTDEEVLDALEDLSKQGHILHTEDGKFIMPRERYLFFRRHYRWLVLISSREFPMFVMMAIALPFMIFTLFGWSHMFGGGAQKRQPTGTVIQDTASAMDNFNKRLQAIEREMVVLKTISPEAKEAAPLRQIEDKVRQLELSTRDLLEALRVDPAKAIQITMLRSDLDVARNEQKMSSQSLQREVERISSYNTTIIIFMITFIAAWMAISITANLRDRKKAT